MRNDEITLQILDKKEQLKNDDYKIVKCFEAMLASKAMPYQISELILKRDKLRSEINELEIRKSKLDESGKEFE